MQKKLFIYFHDSKQFLNSFFVLYIVFVLQVHHCQLVMDNKFQLTFFGFIRYIVTRYFIVLIHSQYHYSYILKHNEKVKHSFYSNKGKSLINQSSQHEEKINNIKYFYVTTSTSSDYYKIIYYFTQFYLIKLYPTCSCPVVPYHTLPFPIQSYPILNYPTLSCLILPYHTISYPILFYPTLFYPALPCPTICQPTLSYHILFYSTLYSPVLPCLSSPIVSSPHLSQLSDNTIISCLQFKKLPAPVDCTLSCK